MVQNIIVGVLFVAMVGAGAFGWWIENGGKDDADGEDHGESDKNK